MLGQLFLLVCLAAVLAVGGIVFVLYGPVPVRRRVTLVPRMSAPMFAPAPIAPAPVAVSQVAPSAGPSAGMTAGPSLVSQLARTSDEFFTPPRPLQVIDEPIPATAAPVPSLRRPTGGKVQPLAKKRSARGTESPAPFAPVVRSGHRPLRDEDVATNPVRLVDTGEMTIVDS